MEQVAKLVIRDLHKTFGDHEVLKGISLDANAGDVISIIGSSGSGKSTLLRCINFWNNRVMARLSSMVKNYAQSLIKRQFKSS